MPVHSRPQGSEFRNPCGRDFAQKGSDHARKDMKYPGIANLNSLGCDEEARRRSSALCPPTLTLVTLAHSRNGTARDRWMCIRSPRKRFSSVTACWCAAFLKKQHIGLSPYNKSPGFRYRLETTLFKSVDGPTRYCGRVECTPHVGYMCGQAIRH
jgi:hypothetical protein